MASRQAHHDRQQRRFSDRGGHDHSLGYQPGIAGGNAISQVQGWRIYLTAASCMAKRVRTVLVAWMLMSGMYRTQAMPDQG